MTYPVPTPEEQVRFLRNVQRLLAEGQFTASYKFALVHAPADLAVPKGEDDGAPLELDTREIATRFVELYYWRQCRPFQVGDQPTGLILRQNTGKPAAVVSRTRAVPAADLAQSRRPRTTCGRRLNPRELPLGSTGLGAAGRAGWRRRWYHTSMRLAALS